MSKTTFEVRRKFGGHLVGLDHDPTVGETVKLAKADVPQRLLDRFLVEQGTRTTEEEPDFAAIARGATVDELKALANTHGIGKGGTKAEMVRDMFRSGVDVEAELEVLRAGEDLAYGEDTDDGGD